MKRYVYLIVALSVLITLMTGCGKPAASAEPEVSSYAGSLFDSSVVHTIDIRIAPKDWQDLLERPQEKIRYRADVAIDGEQTENVSCSAKGNTSLRMVKERYGTDRYSLKIDFGKFEKGQRFHGIRKLNLSNGFMDSTLMKDFLCYTMFRRAGTDAPLCSYAWLTVNGEDYGLFLAVEEIDGNFLKRTGWENGVLYKPDSPKLEAGRYELDQFIKNGIQIADYGKGCELGYRGEAISDYPDIFDHAETKADEEDNLRVIQALKGLSEGKDMDRYLYTDELVRYFAVQNFVLNNDGYTGCMLHNYYLCEKDGRLAMFPWDYNWAFASSWALVNREQSDATWLANYGIDTLLGAQPEQRPMWKWIKDNPAENEAYHRAMDQFLKAYFESGDFEKEIDALTEQLLPYIEKDPTSFTTPERFLSAAGALRTFCLLRAESVRKQLDGKLSSETEYQLPEEQVDASAVTIEDLS